MGGGGSNWPSSVSADQLIQRAVAKDTRANYEQGVGGYLGDLLAEANQRNPEALRTHLDAINNALEKDLGGSILLNYGGSLKKHTYVDGLSDVDVLATLNASELKDMTPAQVRSYFEDRLRERFPNTDITVGKLAVTIRFSDNTIIQILPTLKTSSGIRIPSSDGAHWSDIVRPETFAEELTRVNQSAGGKVVPVVKLLKSLNDLLPGDSRLTGYHIEALAVDAFKGYSGSPSPKAMLMHFGQSASQQVLTPLRDTTGQSRHVDDYLGAANSNERQKASLALRRLAGRMKTADDRASLDDWKQVFGD